MHLTPLAMRCVLRGAALFLIATATNAAQASLAIDETVSLESSTFGAVTGGYESRATIEKPLPLGTFDHDFNASGEIELSFTWRAPAGQKIEVAAPAGWSNASLTFLFRGGNNLAVGYRDYVNRPVTFDGLSGDPVNPNSNRILLGGGSASGSNAYVNAQVVIPLDAGETFSFESLTLTTTVDAGFHTDFDNVSLDYVFLQGHATNGGAPIDPGQWVSLVSAVPEANTFLCGGLVAGVFGLKTTRRKRA